MADAVIGFDTYPHVDMEIGLRGGTLNKADVDGDVKPCMHRQLPLLRCPMQCTLREPMDGFLDYLRQLESQDGMLTATVAMGFPFADIDCMGVTVVAVANGDQGLAESVVDELSQHLWKLKEQLQPQIVTIQEAMDQSRSTDGIVNFQTGQIIRGGAP